MFALASDYRGVNRNSFIIRETLAHIAGAGFTHVHWCHEWKGGYTYSQPEIRQIKEWFDELGLKAKGVHASSGEIHSGYKTIQAYNTERENLRDYVSENEYNRLAGVELIKNRVDLASALAADEIVLHLPFPGELFASDREFKERYMRQVFKSFDECRGYCLERGIRICVENLPDNTEERQMEIFDRLFDRYDSGYMGLCFDTGHGNITSTDGFAFAKRYIERLFSVHMHDNHARASDTLQNKPDPALPLVSRDKHLIPFEGNIRWEDFISILAKSPYQPPFLMEIIMRDGDETEFLKKALEAGKRLKALADARK
jgi:sugar phosphate isomerase/epimerase